MGRESPELTNNLETEGGEEASLPEWSESKAAFT
jgi:hypothetical protein